MQQLRWYFVVPIAVVLLSVDVLAEDEFGYEFRVGGQHTDNPFRTEVDQIDESIFISGLKLTASKETSRFSGSIDSDFEYRHYVDGSFDDENTSSLKADAAFFMVQNTLSWVATNTFGVLISDPFQPETPDNRENINVFGTGPDLDIRLGSRTTLRFGGRYRNVWLEKSDNDYNALEGNIALIGALSPNRSMSLNFSSSRIEFDDTELNSNFDRLSAYIQFFSRASRGTISLDAGYNEIHDFGEVFSSVLARLSISRNISASSSIT
ncbi:MAG: hypothetical protein IIA02_07365, partial [Proteobacteria bacterium]|nr:hypothetical protein [Pseudomonadota bacterium]